MITYGIAPWPQSLLYIRRNTGVPRNQVQVERAVGVRWGRFAEYDAAGIFMYLWWLKVGLLTRKRSSRLPRIELWSERLRLWSGPVPWKQIKPLAALEIGASATVSVARPIDPRWAPFARALHIVNSLAVPRITLRRHRGGPSSPFGLNGS